MGKCKTCGRQFDDSPLYSSKTGRDFVPTECRDCFKIRKACQVRPKQAKGFCRECEYFITSSKTFWGMELKNYCRVKRASVGHAHDDAFQSGTPCTRAQGFTSRKDIQG